MSGDSTDATPPCPRPQPPADSALDDVLWPRVYQELRRLATRLLGDEPRGHTLQPTALVHEAYLRLLGLDASLAAERERFFSVAAHAMRQILIDHARARLAQKRGGDRKREPLDTGIGEQDGPDDWLLVLGEALERLESFDAELARLVELRYFAGLTFEQAARVLGVAPITAKRMWKLAKSWLHREMSDE